MDIPSGNVSLRLLAGYNVAFMTNVRFDNSHVLSFLCVCILFSQSNPIQYNIILYNIQNRKTEKV